MARIFKVSYPTISNWVEKYFPEEFYHRQRSREGRWHDSYLLLLRIVVLIQRGTVVDVVNAFGIPVATARRWVREHLGEEAYQGTLLQKEVRLYSPEIKEAAREMWRNRMTAVKIQEKLSESFNLLKEVNTQLIYTWCRGIPRPADSSGGCYGISDTSFVSGETDISTEEEGPSEDDLRAIEKEVMEGDIYNEGF